MSGPRRALAIAASTVMPLSDELEKLAHISDELATSDVRESTKSTYESLNNVYFAFCKAHKQLDPFAPQTVALYIAARYELKDPKTTLRARLTAIQHAARAAGRTSPLDDPEVRKRARNAAGILGRELPTKRASEATYEQLPTLIDAIQGGEAIQARDRAMILFGFAIGRRGMELAGVDVEHIQFFDDGLLVTIFKSKSNRTGEPEVLGVPAFSDDPLCPCAALKAWLAYSKITTGAVFRTISAVPGGGGNRMRREDVARRLEKIAERANLDGFWRSHSLRRGVVSSAEQLNISRSRTRMLTGWKSDAMFAVYAHHRSKIRESPLHEIYGRRQPQPKLFNVKR
jgi:integrase